MNRLSIVYQCALLFRQASDEEQLKKELIIKVYQKMKNYY